MEGLTPGGSPRPSSSPPTFPRGAARQRRLEAPATAVVTRELPNATFAQRVVILSGSHTHTHTHAETGFAHTHK